MQYMRHVSVRSYIGVPQATPLSTGQIHGSCIATAWLSHFVLSVFIRTSIPLSGWRSIFHPHRVTAVSLRGETDDSHLPAASMHLSASCQPPVSDTHDVCRVSRRVLYRCAHNTSVPSSEVPDRETASLSSVLQLTSNGAERLC